MGGKGGGVNKTQGNSLWLLQLPAVRGPSQEFLLRHEPDECKN